MSAHALMEKPGEGQLYVPPAKVQQFLDEGWTILRPAEEIHMEAGPSLPVAVETMTTNEPPAEPVKTKRKAKK